MVQITSWPDERLLRRPQEEDRRSPQSRRHQERGCPFVRGEPLTVKRYAKLAEEKRPLAPKRRPGSKPKMDQAARRLLEADMEQRPAATLSERREYLGRVAGLSVSESTVSRLLHRMGFSRKKDRWERQSATSS